VVRKAEHLKRSENQINRKKNIEQFRSWNMEIPSAHCDPATTGNGQEPKKDKYFPYDPEVTDLALIVEGKKLHVCKMVLMDASPVFRKMFSGDFKEKDATELELPGKKYSSFVLFLRCIFPREYVTIDGKYKSS
jgi:hypothetical protein